MRQVGSVGEPKSEAAQTRTGALWLGCYNGPQGKRFGRDRKVSVGVDVDSPKTTAKGDAICMRPLVVSMLGVFLYRMMAWSVYGSAFSSTAVSAFTLSRLAQLVATIALIALSSRITQTPQAVKTTTATSTVMLLIGAVFSTGFAPDTAAFTLGRILHGLGSAALLVGWGAYTCSQGPKVAALAVSSAFALYGLATLALQAAPSVFMQAVAFAAPLFCGALLFFEVRLLTNEAIHGEGCKTPRRHGAKKDLPWGVLGMLVACSCACSVSELFITVGQEVLPGYTANMFRAPVFCAIALFFIVWVLVLKRDDPDQLWPLFAFVIFCGLLGYSSFSLFDTAMAYAFMQATQDCLMMFAWIYTAGLVWRNSLPAFAAFGLSTIVFMRTDLLASVFDMAFPSLDVDPGSLATTAISFCMAIALIVYTLVLLNRRPPDRPTATATVPTEGEPAVISSDATAGNDAAEHGIDWAGHFALSAREEQVVDLLLHGYTLPQLADKLGISLNTARWYAKSIYRKLAIHSKAELVELAEKLQSGN